MSAAPSPARRLLALLDEERSLETRPADEIRADLAAFGIDPDGPIRLARRLAERGGDPAARLLGAVLEEEDAEAEIAALESADIGEIRARLQTGTVAAVTADIQRRAGAQSTVVGIKRRRRGAVWAWTGSLVGMAACALIVIAAWWPSSDPAPSPAAVMVERRAAESPALARAPAEPSPDAAMEPVPPAGPVGEMEPASPDANADFANSDPSASTAPGQPLARSGNDRTSTEDRLAAATSLSPGPTAQPARPEMRALSEQPGRPQLEGRLDEGAGAMDESDAAGDVDADSPVGAAGFAASQTIPPPIEYAEEQLTPPIPPPAPAQRRAFGDLQTEMPAEAGEEAASVGAVRVEIPSIRELSAPQPVGDAGSMRGLRVEPSPAASFRAREIADLPYVVADLALFVPWEPALGEIRMDALHVMVDDAVRQGIGDWPGAVFGRRADALGIAGDMAIYALMTLRSGGVDRDAVLVRKETVPPPLADESLRPLLVHWFGDRASDFALITLPDR